MDEQATDHPTDSPHDENTEGAGHAAAESSAVCSAADAVRRAEIELEKARECYDSLRREASERLKAVRAKNIGDLIDGTVEVVRKHPGPGLIAAGVIGFFLGRLFRR